MPYYQYCRRNGITPFIDLNEKRGIKEKYKEDFTIGEDGIPVCKAGTKMNHDGVKWEYPKVQCQNFAGMINQNSERSSK